LLAYEFGLWRSLFHWVLRRPVAPAGAEPFRYAATATPLFLAFIGLSAVEIPVLHLLLPWETVRHVADALGAYGVFWMVGLLATMRVHPHVVGDAGLRVRHGASVDVTIPWDTIATIRARNRPLDSRKAIQCERTDAGVVAKVVILSQTNVDVVLREPTDVGLAEPVREVRLYADDPGALVAGAKRRLDAVTSPTP